MMEQHQPGQLAVIASLLTPARYSHPPVRSTQHDLPPPDTSWDEMARWFGEQRAWAELVATYADVDTECAR